ncbi:uncharacterized protein LOC116246402 [Nymphaea colorata]|nr:uncharacterized protein LOC116246402 [Nymphaea colorata]
MSIQGHILEVRVEFGVNFKQSGAYVCIIYNNEVYQTSIAKDGGTSPRFHENIRIPLVDGLRELSIVVRRRGYFAEEVIATGKVQLDEVLREGKDHSLWPLQYQCRRTGATRSGGQIKLAMEYERPRVTATPCPQAPAAGSGFHPHGRPDFYPSTEFPPPTPPPRYVHPSFHSHPDYHYSYHAPPSPQPPSAPGSSAYSGYYYGHCRQG